MKATVLQKSAELVGGFPKEILNPFSAAKEYRVAKYKPSEPLNDFIECYWVMRWDETSELPYVCEVLPSPYINLTFMPRGPRITGIPKGKLLYKLNETSPILGVQFKAGGLYPFWQQSVHQLTDSFIEASNVFADIDVEFNDQLLAIQNDKIALSSIEKVLMKKVPQQDKNIELICKIITDATNIETPSVTAIADAYSMSVRSLQDLFKRYVGVGLKWIIQRDRLQKAVQHTIEDRTIEELAPSWSMIAVELGYVDQSHFINHFKRVIGISPTQYADILRASI